MGNSEEGKPCMPEKPLSPARDQNGTHVYPNWAMMQAYYGPRYAVPPYLNPAVASPQNPPPYMWIPPQSMIPPYGMPYGAFYAHGGIYGHPGVPLASPGFSTDVPVKSSGDPDGGSMKKSKEVDGLANSIGNGNAESGENGTDHRLSESDDTDNSSDGSNGVTVKAGQRGRKRRQPRSSISGGRGSESTLETSRPANAPLATEENMDTTLEFKDPSILNVKPIAIHAPRSSIASEAWFQNERELKQEKRKQSNRESARRSRLRKQAEAEELVTTVHALTTENTSLKSKIREFMEISERLNLENAKLMEKLNDETDDSRLKPVGTANLLVRVNDNDHNSNSRTNEDNESYEKRTSGTKFHQLLDAIASPRSDAVAAN